MRKLFGRAPRLWPTLFVLTALACSGESEANQPATGGTLLFDVVDTSWTIGEPPPAIERMPAEIRDLVVLVPTEPPPGEANGFVYFLAERAVPANNYYGTVRIEWGDPVDPSTANLASTAVAKGPTGCQNRIQGGGWEATSVRGVDACRLLTESDQVVLEWGTDESTFHFESGAMSEADAIEWLETWVRLR